MVNFIGVGSLLVALVSLANGFYLPGVAPRDYSFGEKIDLKVNKLTSSKTDLSYEYYNLPFCRPDKVEDAAENLGEILTGNIIQNSPYEIEFLKTKYCAVLCKQSYQFFQIRKFVNRIKELYIVNWIVDNLPSALRIEQQDDSNYNLDQPVEFYQGFPLGGSLIDAKTGQLLNHFVNNHQRIIIKYHAHRKTVMQDDLKTEDMNLEHGFDANEIAVRIVGLDVEPMSIKHQYTGEWKSNTDHPELTTCPPGQDIRQFLTPETVMALDGFSESDVQEGNPKLKKKRKNTGIPQSLDVVWTYDVIWEPSDTKWATRWDVYLNANAAQNDDVHWFAIVNSLLIVVFLTGMVAMIMMRTLHRDLTRYNRVPTEEEKAEDREETGWKLVHGDVFRPPTRPLLFSVTIGTGVQVLSMAFFTLIFASIGFLSPANRGSLMIALLLLFVLMGTAAGYYAARTYKGLNGKEWQKCTIWTALLYPGIIFGILFVLNLFVWAEGSANAIPFFSLVSVLLLWFGISLPLTFLGAFYGYKKDADEPPVKTQDIPRQIPTQPWYMTPVVTILMGGILPFGAVFVELFFVLSSLWLEQYYYVFGFLFIVFIILVITCAEITVVLCYFQLCGEDYQWQWRSLLTSGSSAVYLYLYSIVYFWNRLQIDLVVSAIIYFGYMFILSLMFFLATSVVGYFACNWFVYKIYAAVKVD